MEECSIAGSQEGAVQQGENLVGIATDTTGVGGGVVDVGTGGSAEFVRQDSAGSNGLISAAHPRKPLRKKSVSFTGEENYPILRGATSPSPLPSHDPASGGSGTVAASPVGVALASSFFLRSSRPNSSMVTPHAAYAVRAKNILSSASKLPTSTSLSAPMAPARTAPHPAAAPYSRDGGVPFPSPVLATGGLCPGPGLGLSADNLVLATSDALRYDGMQRQESLQIQRSSSSPSPARTTPADDASSVSSGVPNGATLSRTAPVVPAPGGEGSAGGNVDGAGASKRRRLEADHFGVERMGTAAARRTTAESGLNRAQHEDREHQQQYQQEVREEKPDYAAWLATRNGRRDYLGREWKAVSALPTDPHEGNHAGEGKIAEMVKGAEGARVRRAEAVDLTDRGGGFETPSGLAPLDKLDSSVSSGPEVYDDVIDRQVEEEEDDDDEDEEDGERRNDDEESVYLSDEHCALAGDEVYTPGFDGDRGQWSTATSPENSRNGNNNGYNTESGRRSHRRDGWDIGSRYKFIRTLGKGSYGEVAQCEDLQEGGKVAIKRLATVFDSEVDAKRIYREMYILRHTKHDEIIRLRDVILPPSYEDFRDLYLVFEFVDTDLYKLIGSPQFLTDEHIKLFMYQLLVGLKYIHSAHVIHRDMKPANILLNEDCTLKICDFGLSRVVTQDPPRPVETTRSPPRSACGCNSSAAGKLACSPVKPSSLPPGVAAPGAEDIGACHEGEGGCHAGEFSRGSGKEDCDEDDEPPQQATRVLKRQLTKHVVTRWYRAPELILLQDYNNAVDVWSLGCIMAELLSMQEASFSTSQERNALFPGKTCFPLSADQPSSYSDALDQLNVIFDVIGTPSAEDIEDLGEVRQYLARLSPKKPMDLKEKYAGASDQALDLLVMMLRFDPSKRITVDEALEHPYLASCRKPEREVTARIPITMEFENIKTDKATLKRLIYEEVLHYHQSRPGNSATRATLSSRPVAPPPKTSEDDSSRKRSRENYESSLVSAAYSGTASRSVPKTADPASGPIPGTAPGHFMDPRVMPDKEERRKRRRGESQGYIASTSAAVAAGTPDRLAEWLPDSPNSRTREACQKRQGGH